MAIHLSTREATAFERASSALLSPFAFESTDAWRRAACLAVEQCVGGEGSSFALPAPDVPLVAAEPQILSALQAIVPPPDWLVEGLTIRRPQLNLRVAAWDEVYDVTAVKRSEFYNENVLSSRLLAPLHMMADTGLDRLPSVLAIYSSDEKPSERSVARRKAILQLLYPAYAAGLRAFVAFRHRRLALSRMADNTTLGVVFFDRNRGVRQENEYFQRLMFDEPERERVREEVARTVRNVLTMLRSPIAIEQPTATRLQTRRGCYRITAMVIDEQWSGDATAVVAIVERVAHNSFDQRRRPMGFPLTPRELEVAQLLRGGLTTREIAEALAITVNTARRHVERILAKLDVHNRTAAAAKLFEVD